MAISIFYKRTPTRNDYHTYGIKINEKIMSVTVTASPDVVKRWIRHRISQSETYLNRGILVVGLGVEWTPRAETDPCADTLQLCVGLRCLVFQVSRADFVPRALRKFLRNPRCTFVCFWSSCRETLSRSRHALYMGKKNLVNLRSMMYGAVASGSVETIAERYLGYRRHMLTLRDENFSDWRSETLSDSQVLQVSLIAYCAFLIGILFRVWLYRDTVTLAHMEPSHKKPSTVENIEEEDPTQNPPFARRSGSEKKVTEAEPKAQRKLPSIFEELQIDPFEDDDVFEEFEINEEYDDEDEVEAVTQPWEDDWDDHDDSDDFSLELRRELEKVKEKEKEKEKNTDDKN